MAQPLPSLTTSRIPGRPQRVPSLPASWRRRASALTLALCAFCPAAAHANPPSDGGERSRAAEVTRLNEEGAAFYEARQFRKAVESFLQAYSIDHDPNLLFNIARCYEKLGDDEAALEKYREFLATPGTEAEGRRRAAESISALEALSKGEAQGARSEPAPGSLDQRDAAIEAPSGERDDATDSSLGAWPWIALGAGTLVTAGGGVLYALGERDHGALRDASGYGTTNVPYAFTEAEARQRLSAGDSKKQAGALVMGGGALLLLGSAVLFWLDADSSAEASSVSFAITPEDGGAAIFTQGRF